MMKANKFGYGGGAYGYPPHVVGKHANSRNGSTEMEGPPVNSTSPRGGATVEVLQTSYE